MHLFDIATDTGLTPDRWSALVVFLEIALFSLGVLVAVKL